MKKSIKAWAWVYTDPKMQHAPIIAIDERKQDVAEEKRNCFKGKDAMHGKLMRSLYRQSKVLPVTITYEL